MLLCQDFIDNLLGAGYYGFWVTVECMQMKREGYKMTRVNGMRGYAAPVVFLLMIFSFMLFTPRTWAAGDAAKGEKVYKANCAVCHGDKGDGKGPGGAALTPQPTNFTSLAEMEGVDDVRLHKSIMEGLPGTAMIGFAKTMKPGDIEDVIAYIKTLGGFRKAK